MLKSLLARLRVRAFKYIVINNYELWEWLLVRERERERERARCLLSIAERTASAATVCLNLDLSVRVPVGRFLLVAMNDVRAVCPWLGTVCPRAGVILVVSGFSNLLITTRKVSKIYQILLSLNEEDEFLLLHGSSMNKLLIILLYAVALVQYITTVSKHIRRWLHLSRHLSTCCLTGNTICWSAAQEQNPKLIYFSA